MAITAYLKFRLNINHIYLLFTVLLISSPLTVCQLQPKRLLLILLDGFSPEYLDFVPKNGGFQTLIQEGVMAEYMKPGYPTESYPGYYEIATGLWGESNGIPLNVMYDKTTDSVFQILPDENSEKPFWWEEAEPIWITTTKNNVSTGSFRWPGAEIPHHGVKPKIATSFDRKFTLPLGDDIDIVLDLFVSKDLQYAQIYSQFADIWGHIVGPVITEQIVVPWFLDRTIKSMMKKIHEKGLQNSVNVIVLSDHGMARSDMLAVKMLRLQDVLDQNDVKLVLQDGSHVAVIAEPGKEQKVYNDLKKLGTGAEVYWKKDLPERYHIKHSERIPDIFVVIKKGYFLDGLHGSKKQTPENPLTYVWEGYHGYEAVDYPEMNAIFIGWGPDFKKGQIYPPIDIVDPYNLIAHLVGVEPCPNNGSWDNVKDMVTL